MSTLKLPVHLKSILSHPSTFEKQHMNHFLGNNGSLHVKPTSEQEIAAVLKYATEHGKKVVIEGNGTKKGFGGLIDTADLLLSLTEYSGIVEHTVGDMTVTVKAGTPFGELQTYLKTYNQQVSLDPALGDYATIGGVIAANESGPKRLSYGSARDAVIGMRVVYSDGTIVRSGGKVVKNVAGYDMNKLFIGSMGTLGVISEITLKLRPLPKYQSIVFISFSTGNIEEIHAFVSKVLDSMIEPVALELLNPSLAEDVIGQHLFTLVISFEDVESSVHYQENYIKSIQPADTILKILQEKEAEVFWGFFSNISPNGACCSSEEETEAALKIGVPNMNVLDVINKSTALKTSRPMLIKAHGGVGHGLCSVYIKGSEDVILSVITSFTETAKTYGGYVVVKHLPFILRQKVNVWGEKPSHFPLLTGIKAKIDAKNVLNYKRFIGGI
ncbi:FAD-binding oxidoreductase [Priestia megaterium]|uniref:FAD-binding oxidoreductase n=1 Tax=Priestia megaterium TaxID=1404 RepID=UPI00070A20D9|nr:FAD-binding oxidoreductase [Priestia megaterium]KRD99748.1 lactate dehydrogenase [Bacillus sp. Root239]MCM3541953.1 FAD-binding oxidoreductase [Priestia megaterium]MEC1070185.1 FAD-binding oxidoreductase [Priestia megaterium]